jgi:glycosyltransferase involved in cell wall biosynthesis
MRIGIVTGEFPPLIGGVGAYSHILAKELVLQGHTVSIFSSIGAESQDVDIKVSNVKKWGIGSLFSIHKWASEERLDIINLQFQTAAYGMSPWIHFLPDVMGKIPVVTTFHDLRYPYLFPKAGQLRNWIVIRLAHVSGGVIVTNHEDQMQLQHIKNTTIIPIGSNILTKLPDNFDAQYWREKAGAKSGDFLLGYFGLFNRSKGLDHLLRSAAGLRDADIPVRLVMIGGGAGMSDPTNAAYIDEMNQQIVALGLKNIVQQTGYVDDEAVGAYLSACDAVALPFTDGASYRRGSLMAAIHYGCPIITTTPQVPVAAFRDRDNLLMVKADDTPALQVGIQQLYEAPDLREKLKRGAAQLAYEFEWSGIAEATANFFRQTIEDLV